MARRKKLPKKLSEAILVALKDLAAAERSKNLVINMGTWHDPIDSLFGPGVETKPKAKCEVCFAGSVMAGTLGVKDTEQVVPDDFGENTRDMLLALDSVREGDLYEAVNHINTDWAWDDAFWENNWLPKGVTVHNYDVDPKAWKADMRKISRLLQKAGL